MALGTPQGEAESTDAGARLNAVPEEDATVLDGRGAGVSEVEEDGTRDIYQTPPSPGPGNRSDISYIIEVDSQQHLRTIRMPYEDDVGGPSASFANRTTVGSGMSAGRFDMVGSMLRPSAGSYSGRFYSAHGGEESAAGRFR